MRTPRSADQAIEVLAPAKLNLFLELHRRRADGFHELETVMVAIDRFDRLQVRRRRDDDVRLRSRWAPSAAVWQTRLGIAAEAPDDPLAIPEGPENLVVRALRRFAAVFAEEKVGPGGFDVDLEKQIPAGAGMGGASSDAAAALRAAASLWGVATRDVRLRALAAELGSDVPFFLGVEDAGDPPNGHAALATGRAALATGRGEILHPLEMHRDLHVVICYPSQGLSTARVYAHCQIPTAPVPAARLAAALKTPGRQRLGTALRNRLGEPARQLLPQMDRILQEMHKTGVLGAQMTGSGSACFGIAPTRRTARRAGQLLSSRGRGVTMVARAVAVPGPIKWLAA
jgi:4-diphosphocytidyl-2-C-methyl-D-erythritol kinase